MPGPSFTASSTGVAATFDLLGKVIGGGGGKGGNGGQANGGLNECGGSGGAGGR